MKTLIYKSEVIKRNKPQNYSEGDFDNCAAEFSYSTYDVLFRSLKYCFISIEGSIYKYAIRLFKDSLVSYKQIKDFPLRRRLREIYRFEKIFLSPKEKYLVAFDAWSIGHYHWITEALPRLNVLRAELSDFTVLLPDCDYVRTVGLNTMDILKLNPKSIVFIKRNQLFFASKIYFVSQIALTGYINDKIVRTLRDNLDQALAKGTTTTFKKIYVSRRKARMRKVVNESEVQGLLISKGFEVVYFEEMALAEQIALCRQSDTIVSIHGAGLTNMIFMPKGSKVLEFRRSEIFVNQCYWHLADSLNHKYYYLFGEPDSEQPIEGDGCNLTIPIEQLSSLIELMKSSNQQFTEAT